MSDIIVTKRSRVRSPAYPSLGLPGAIEKVRLLYDREHRTPASVAVAASAWGYSSKSSAGPATIAALKHFGLLEESGRGDDRQVRISDLAFDILIEPGGSEKQLTAIRSAAMIPALFRQLWEEFGDHGSEQNLQAHLLRLGYNRNAVRPCIQHYRETIKVAYPGGKAGEPIDSDEPAEVEDHTVADEGSRAASPLWVHYEAKGWTPRAMDRASGHQIFTISLPGEGEVVLRTPRRIGADSMKLLRPWLDRCWDEVTKPENEIPKRPGTPAAEEGHEADEELVPEIEVLPVSRIPRKIDH